VISCGHDRKPSDLQAFFRSIYCTIFCRKNQVVIPGNTRFFSAFPYAHFLPLQHPPILVILHSVSGVQRLFHIQFTQSPPDFPAIRIVISVCYFCYFHILNAVFLDVLSQYYVHFTESL